MTITRLGLMAALLAATAAATACGGGKKADTTPDESGGEGGDTVEVSSGESSGGDGGDMVAPEQMDEIQRMFDRKRGAVSRCLSAAVDAKELPKNSRGKVTLNVVVGTNGRAGEVRVIHATLESKLLSDCVIGKVKEIIFPEVPKPFPTSYTYAFEAM